MSPLDVIERLDKMLDGPHFMRSDLGNPIQTTMGARFAELVAINGGRTAVVGWGTVCYFYGLYGREGLDKDEALELAQITSFLTGVFFAVPEAMAFVERKMDVYWAAQLVLKNG